MYPPKGGISISKGIATVVVLLLLALYPSVVTADGGNTVVGSTVKWSSAQGDLLVWPHTSNDLLTQTQYANLTWKLATTNIDVAFKFSIPITGRIYLWQNISHPATVYDYGSQTSCSTSKDNATQQNVTVCWNQTVITGSHTEQRYYYDWNDVSGAFTHTVVNGSHYYWITNVAFTQGETKQVKWQYAVPTNSSGKWSLLVKRSQDTLESALAGNLFVELDPWWNSSWSYKKNITITNTHSSAALPANYTVNLTFNHASLVSDGKSLASGDDVRVVYNGATELDRINVTAFNTGATTILFRTQASIPASGSASNYELYYGNSNAGAPPADPNNVYLVWDDFNGTNGAALNSSRWGVLGEGSSIVDIQSNQARFYSPQQTNHDAEAWSVKNFTNTTGLDITFDWASWSCGNNARWRDGLFPSTSTSIGPYPTGQNLHVSDGCTPGAAGYNVYRNSTSVFNEGQQTPPKTIRFSLDTDNWMKVYKDGALSWNGTWNRTQGDFHFYFDVGGGGSYGEAITVYFDNVKVRKYLYPEPTASLGGEEIFGISFNDSKFSPLFGGNGTNFTFQVSINNSNSENTNVNLTVLNASNSTVATGSTSLANGSGVASVSVQINDIGAHNYHWTASSSQSGEWWYPASGELQGPAVFQNTTFSQYKMVPQNVSKLIWSVAWGKLVTGGVTGAVNLSLKDPFNTTYNEFSPNVETSVLELRNLNVTLPVIGYELGYYSEVRKVAVSNPTAGLWEMRATQDGNVITFETRVQMNSAG